MVLGQKRGLRLIQPMPIFKINNKKLENIKETKIDVEKDIQILTENNLVTIFGLKVVSTEFALSNLRIDTLAYNEEAKSFVIIEYKRDRSFSVIDQGYAYLGLMLNNKADFILEYNEKMSSNLKRDDIDWSQSRVIFIANSFTTYQEKALNFKDLPIELWEVKKYDNLTILYNQLKSADSSESIKTVSKNKTVESVSREVKKYSIEDHLKSEWKESRELFDILREKILALGDNIEEKPNRNYTSYKIGYYLLVGVHPCRSKLDLHMPKDKDDLKDPDNKVIKIPWEKRGWGKTCYYMLTKPEEIDYAMFLIKQVYQALNKN